MHLTRRSLLFQLGLGSVTLLLPDFLMQGVAKAGGEKEGGNEKQEITLFFNQIRRKHGLSIVVADDRLALVAKNQAQLMAKKGKLSHNVGFGNGFKARLHKAGVRGMAAENIAAGQPDYRRVFAAWMQSKRHRHNMLDPSFSRYGLAYATHAKRPDYRYWAIVLGR